MSEKELDTLIAAYLSGTISDQDSKKLNQWLNDPEKRKVFEKIEMVWNEDSQEPVLKNTNVLIEELWSASVKKDRYFSMKWMAVAASVTVILILSFLAVTQDYLSPDNEVEQWETHWNPSGQKSKIHLSDGTVVWLNALSTLSYKKGFTDSSRVIKLEGEAFFDVSRDPKRVFEVITRDISVTALGTSFNVNAYPDEHVARVALVSGRVEVKLMRNVLDQMILSPGEEVTYTYKNSSFLKGKSNLEEIVGWKNGILHFTGAGFGEVINRLEQWYAVEIEIKGESPKDWALTARFENQSLENVLKNLKFQKQFNYEIKDGDKVILSF